MERSARVRARQVLLVSGVGRRWCFSLEVRLIALLLFHTSVSKQQIALEFVASFIQSNIFSVVQDLKFELLEVNVRVLHSNALVSFRN